MAIGSLCRRHSAVLLALLVTMALILSDTDPAKGCLAECMGMASAGDAGTHE